MNSLKIRDTRRKGFFTVDNELIDEIAKLVGTTALTVYITLCRHADKEQTAFPSQQAIADKIGVSRDTVIDKIGLLAKHKLIQIDQTKDQATGKWMHNTYTLTDKTVWIKQPYGGKLHTGEANTVSTNSDTNNTNVLTKPMVTQKLIVNDDLLNERFLQEQETKRIKKTTPKTRFPASIPQFPQYPQRREGTANGKGIR